MKLFLAFVVLSPIASRAAVDSLTQAKHIEKAAIWVEATYTARSCEQAKAGPNLDKDCLLMGVADKEKLPEALPIPLKDRLTLEREKFYAYALKCPSENKGVFEFIRKNRRGRVLRNRIKYVKDKPVFFNFTSLGGGEQNTEYFNADITKPNPDKVINDARDITVARNIKVKVGICDGDAAAKANFLQFLEDNRRKLAEPLEEKSKDGSTTIDAK